jgi:tetratricopeptide (TPR) repeat protein
MSDNLVSRAVGAYDKVFTLDQVDQAEICKKMGLDLAYRGRLDEALDALRKALALRPHDGHISLELGVVQLRRGAPQAALEHFQVAKDTGLVSYRLHRQLAEALLRLERDEEALAELDEAVHLKPSLPENHYRRGVVLDRLGRFGDALAAFSKAIELAPDDVVYHQTLGFTLESMGRRGEAIKCFKRALELERAVAAAKAEADAEAEA